MAGQRAKPEAKAIVKVKRPRARSRLDKVDKEKAIELKMQGNTYAEIAKIQDCTPQAVHQAISNILPTLETEEYKRKRHDIFAELQRKLLFSIVDDDITKTPAIQRITGAAILYDKERLETGKSSSNVNLIVERIMQEKALDT